MKGMLSNLVLGACLAIGGLLLLGLITSALGWGGAWLLIALLAGCFALPALLRAQRRFDAQPPEAAHRIGRPLR